ncbi:MAG: 3-phosphoglycerate dehydrogenase [Thaumarchaeota archaeon]|nr:3-phosphoglycerate dehydrogenase [Nitrososphaerota archaeon]
MRTGVLVTGSVPGEAAAILSGYDVYEVGASEDVVGSCEVLMAWPSRVEAGLIGKMTSLRMVQSLSAGVDALPLAAIPDTVEVFSNAGAYTEPVAEHAWGLLLGLAKGVQTRKQRTIPRKLRGRTLLVVGAGEIGSEVAMLGKSLQMRIIGVSRSFKKPELYDARHHPSDLKNVIGSADAVVLSLPLTKQTRDLIDYDTLARCGQNVLVVNVGRGETVVEEDLIRWLKERPGSRYATDVFWKREGKEVFDTLAWELPNFGGTLHNSGVPLGETLTVPFVRAAQNVRRFLETGEAANRVDLADYL